MFFNNNVPYDRTEKLHFNNMHKNHIYEPLYARSPSFNPKGFDNITVKGSLVYTTEAENSCLIYLNQSNRSGKLVCPYKFLICHFRQLTASSEIYTKFNLFKFIYLNKHQVSCHLIYIHLSYFIGI